VIEEPPPAATELLWSITLEPLQIVVFPFAVITGWGGAHGLTTSVYVDVTAQLLLFVTV
jgi:hypothetical protein